ncbi:glutamate-rich protein 3 isoform X9 [Hypanus sabinus]|uniref:glutamate-rich protein 3 isoform X9 n=1 Tax=Hypanus sabinus TaxID=79690 RepID=UPI0028C4DD15|nr:glutamate-rich protein 3 isoform X9 [Hypanus sabinus]
MSRTQSGPLEAYNSLTDKHLTGYFNNTRIRRHLQRVGLVTRSGRIVSEKEYRLSIVRKDHQRYVRESLAQAIFHKVLSMEVDRKRRPDEDLVPFLSPRPPAASRNCQRSLSGPNVMQPSPSTSTASPRPSTAPGKMQRPTRLIPLHSNGASSTAAIATHCSLHTRQRDTQPELVRDINPNFLHGQPEREVMRHWQTVDTPSGLSPYRLPIINNYVTPVPPPLRPWGKSTFSRGRRLRPPTAPHAPGSPAQKEVPRWRRSAGVHSNVVVTMVYRGKRLHLSYDQADARDEVKVHQQHCGGENLCVFKGKLMEAERFEFVSRRHAGFPFSLTFFLNGLQVDRLSSCCEFRHRRGSRLGGRHPHFTIVSVQGATPCYRCIIATGLDKKPSPPPKQAQGRESRKLGLAKQGRGVRMVRTAENLQSGASPSATAPEQDGMDEDQEMSDCHGALGQEYADDFEEDAERPGKEAEPCGQGREEAVGAEDESGSGEEGHDQGLAQEHEFSNSLSDAESEESSGSIHSHSSSSGFPRSSEESDRDSSEAGVHEGGRAASEERAGEEPKATVEGEADSMETLVPGVSEGDSDPRASVDNRWSIKDTPTTGGEQPGAMGDGWRGSMVDVCAAELSVSGRSAAGK